MGECISLYNILNNKVGGIKKNWQQKNKWRGKERVRERERERERAVKSVSTDGRVRVVK